MSNRTHKVMARREWAFSRVKQLMPVDTMAATLNDAAWLLKAEHARAVRVVKKAERMELRKVLDTDTNEYLAGYQQAVSDILAALQRGRG